MDIPQRLILDKKVGETPLQVLDRLRTERPELERVSLTYAGRLDPMAEGKLLVLIGDECKNRSRYDGLDKEYEFEVLLGFKSDTGDVLGLADSCSALENYSSQELQKVARAFVGTHALPYPAFSSKTLRGKPLFHQALAGELDSTDIPVSNVRIFKIDCLGVRTISGEKLLEDIVAKINLLRAPTTDPRPGTGFRKEEIVARWKSFSEMKDRQYTIARFKTVVSSGTYMRTLGPGIAEKLGTCGLAYSIRRTKIGRFLPITKGVGFWWRLFI